MSQSSESGSQSDDQDDGSPANNSNHNRNSNNSNHNARDSESDSELLFDENKNEIEDEESSGDENANEEQKRNINWGTVIPSFISKRPDKLKKVDDEIYDIALCKVVDTAQSLSEYNRSQEDFSIQSERLKNVMDRLLRASKTLRIEQLMYDRLTDEIRNGALDDEQKSDVNGSQSQSQQPQRLPDDENPTKTGDWESYLETARNKLVQEIDNGAAQDTKAAQMKQFFRDKPLEFKQQLTDALTLDEIEGFEDDEEGENRNHNRNRNGSDSDEDEDLVIENNRNKDINVGSITCPLTKAIFREPVKSKQCGHTFEKAAIQQYLSAKERNQELCECPLPGCTNILNKDQMVRDVKMERTVKAASKNDGDEDSDEDDGCFDLTVTSNRNASGE